MIASQNMQWTHWLNNDATATAMQIAQWHHWKGYVHCTVTPLNGPTPCTVTPQMAQQDHSNGPTDWEGGGGGKVGNEKVKIKKGWGKQETKTDEK